MPVGFYLKTFIRPRFAWRTAERGDPVARRVRDRCPLDASGRRTVVPRYVAVRARSWSGPGIAGPDRRAARPRRTGERVLAVRRVRDAAAPRRAGSDARRGPALERARPVEPGDQRSSKVTPRSACSTAERVPRGRGRARSRVRADRVVAATERHRAHQLFPATTCPACWLGRAALRDGGAARRRRPGRRVVVVASTDGGRGAPAGARRGGDPGRRRASCRRRSWTRYRTRPRPSWTASSWRRAGTGVCAR